MKFPVNDAIRRLARTLSISSFLFFLLMSGCSARHLNVSFKSRPRGSSNAEIANQLFTRSLPSGVSNRQQVILKAEVPAASTVVKYRYAVQQQKGQCAEATYSDWIPLAQESKVDLGADGIVAFCVQTTDKNAKEILTREQSWVKDTQPPSEVQLAGVPLNPSNASGLNVSIVNDSDIAAYKYWIGDGNECGAAVYSAWRAITTLISDDIGVDGNKVLCVLGKDSVGNAQIVPTQYVWVKNSVPPAAIVLAGTPQLVATDASIDVTVIGVGLTEYRYDLRYNTGDCAGASYGPWTLSATHLTSALGVDGDYRLCVQGRDAAGNIALTPTEFGWTKDTTAPTAVLSGVPANPSNATTLNISIVSAGDIAVYKYWTGNGNDCGAAVYGAWRSIALPVSDAIGLDGNKVLCVLGKDSVGNAQIVPTQYVWVKSSLPPASIVLAGTPQSVATDASIDVTVIGVGLTEYRYALRYNTGDCVGASYGPWTLFATHLTSALGVDGGYRLCVQGRDAAGNIALTPTEYGWTKDTTAPTVVLSGVPANPSNATSLNISIVSAGDIAVYKYWTGNGNDCGAAVYGAWRSIALPVSDAIGVDGNKVLCVLGKDSVGNAQIVPTQYVWVKNSLPPAAALLSGTPSAQTNQSIIDVTVSGVGLTAYRSALVNGGSCTGATYGLSYSINTHVILNTGVDGQKTLCVLGSDAAGNEQLSPTSYSWTLDTLPPTGVVLAGTPQMVSTDGSIDVTVIGTDLAEYRYLLRLNAGDCIGAIYGSWTPAATHITNALGVDGNYRLCVQTRDALGNTAGTATEYGWTKDTTAPTVALSGTPTNPSSAVNLNVSILNDGQTAFYKYWTGFGTDCSGATYGAWTPVATPITAATGGDGVKALCVLGKDSAGNIQVTPTLFTWTKTSTLANQHKNDQQQKGSLSIVDHSPLDVLMLNDREANSQDRVACPVPDFLEDSLHENVYPIEELTERALQHVAHELATDACYLYIFDLKKRKAARYQLQTGRYAGAVDLRDSNAE